MIANIETVNTDSSGTGSLRWRCKHCGGGFVWKYVGSIYILTAAGTITLMTFGGSGDMLHRLIHRCGDKTEAAPLRSRPEWT